MKKYLQWLPWNTPYQRLNNGSLLIELAVVLVLITCMALLTSTSGSFLQRMAVRAEVVKLCNTFTYLQQYALTSNQPQTLTFDIGRNAYQYHGCEQLLHKQVTFGAMVGLQGPPSAPTHTIGHPSTFPHDTVTFYPDGIIQAGTIYITDVARSCSFALSSGVAAVSHLRCYHYTNQWQPWYTHAERS